MTVNTMNGMKSLRDCGEDVYCSLFFATYFSPHSATFVPLSFTLNPDILRDFVHLEADFGEGGLELEPPTCVRRSVCGMLYAGDAGIVSESTEDCEHDHHCDRFRISRPRRDRYGNGDNAAPHTQQDSPGSTARCRSDGPEVSMQTMHFLCWCAVLSTQAPTLCRK